MHRDILINYLGLMNKIIRYIKELEDEKGKPLNKWAVYEETITQKGN